MRSECGMGIQTGTDSVTATYRPSASSSRLLKAGFVMNLSGARSTVCLVPPRFSLSQIRDGQLLKASQLRTTIAVAATVLTVGIAWIASATLPGRSTATQQSAGASIGGSNGSFQSAAQNPFSVGGGASSSGGGASSSGGGYGGGFVFNSGGS